LNLEIDREKETARPDTSRLGQGTSRLISCISREGQILVDYSDKIRNPNSLPSRLYRVLVD